ncbi:MAG: hypothetical protein IPL46_13815 [Saprospiraceae bacterium]|nr:hypothetical protein [Saprospiraceae bacterium]
MKALLFILILLQSLTSLQAQEQAIFSEAGGIDSMVAEISTNDQVISNLIDSSVAQGDTRTSRPSLILLRDSDMLTRLSVLPIYTWSDSVRHISPLPQDFYKIFETGADEKSISINDAMGVSLAGVKALSMDMKRYDLVLIELHKTNEELSRKSRSLERVVEKQRKELELLKRQMQDIINRLPR